MDNKKSCSMNVTAKDLGVDEIVYDAIDVDVVGFGALNVDKLYQVANIAGVDGESFIKSQEDNPGGSAANTIIGLSKLGLITSYVGKIANDEDGELLEYNLMANNVYTNNLIYTDKGNSGKVLGFVSDAGDRELYVDSGVNDEITIDEINPLNINQTKILHYSSFVGDSINAQKELLNIIDDDIILSFDPGMLYAKKGIRYIDSILRRTNILLINEIELKILFEDYYKEKLNLTNNLSFRDLAIYLRNDGIDNVIVKRGSEGVYAINKNDLEVKAPAFEVEAVDTTCAGDSFNAGFLYAYLKGYDLVKSCIIANWVASKSVCGIGISSLATKEELLEFIKDEFGIDDE